MQRSDGRGLDEIRPLNFELNVAPYASGSVLVSMGKTRVICAVTIDEAVPRWMKEQGVTGGCSPPNIRCFRIRLSHANLAILQKAVSMVAA